MGWGGRTWHHLARFWPELGFPWDLGSRGKAATWPPPRGPPHWHPMFPPSFTQTLASRQGLADSLAMRPLQHRCALRWSLSCESPRAVLSSHHFGGARKKKKKTTKDPSDKLVGFAVLSTSDAEVERQPVLSLLVSSFCWLPAPSQPQQPGLCPPLLSPSPSSSLQVRGSAAASPLLALPFLPGPRPPGRASSQRQLPSSPPLGPIPQVLTHLWFRSPDFLSSL